MLVFAVLVCVAFGSFGWSAPLKGSPEMLYNGIELPAVWPPNYGESPRDPMPVPYLENPPTVIPIDLGRQLFVDDFLVERTTLDRSFHRAEPYEGNPVLRPERPWESRRGAASAAPFSDGVWYDPADELYKMWYMAPPPAEEEENAKSEGRPPLYMTCLAFSRDGIHWNKPEFDVVPGTNIVLTLPRDSTIVWIDQSANDPGRRFLLMRNHRVRIPPNPDKRTHALAFTLHYSGDGIHWSESAATTGGLWWLGDRHSAFFNPFRKVWVFSMRNSVRNDPALVGMRARLYHENADPEEGLRDMERHPWVRSDRLDPRHPKFPDFEPQLYNLDAVAYESLILGLFSILEGPENEDSHRLEIHKRNEILLGFSRDGYHWDRPDRRPFIGVNETDGAWNWGNVQSVGGGCLVVGDRLYFYCSGRRWSSFGKRGGNSTGLAFLRRDGFASMDAGEEPGTLTTRLISFTGKHLFVNADIVQGELRAEVLDEAGEVIEPFTVSNCQAFDADSTGWRVRWEGAKDLALLAGQPVRFRFHLRNGSLYAFWVSPNESGYSRGFVAAGGPGFKHTQDIPPGESSVVD